MLEQRTMYLIFKSIAAVIAVMFISKALDQITYLIILSLAFACLFLVTYLLEIKLKDNLIPNCFYIGLLLTCFALDSKSFFPIIIITSVQLFDYYIKGSNLYYLVIISVLLGYFVMEPSNLVASLTVILLGLLLYCRWILTKEIYYRKQLLTKKEEVAKLTKRLQDNKRLIKTLQYTAALEERNRLATRLHDKIGHGISGSIILLEASMLLLDQNLPKAKEGIERAVDNLRTGVDDIRMALREERPVKSELGLNEIKAMLEQFELTHNRKTELTQTGNLNYITLDMWECIYENTTEVLTNLLKHSDATRFRLVINVVNKVVKVEYKDNGHKTKEFHCGFGLEGIKERTIKCGGRCFIEQETTGFIVRNIFSLS